MNSKKITRSFGTTRWALFAISLVAFSAASAVACSSEESPGDPNEAAGASGESGRTPSDGGTSAVVAGGGEGGDDASPGARAGRGGGGGKAGTGGAGAGTAGEAAGDAGDTAIGGAAGVSGTETAGGGGRGPASGCNADADCEATLPETSPAGCAEPRCNPVSAECEYFARDLDGDGFAAKSCRSTSGVTIEVGLDCNDDPEDLDAPQIYPGANEHCNNLDDDCDGAYDEDIPPDTTQTCVSPAGADPAINQCAQTGYATCQGGTWSGCSAVPKDPQPDHAFCDGKSYDCNNTPDDGCPCGTVGTSGHCTTDIGCTGTRTCTLAGWGACQRTDASCVCQNGATASCVGPHDCPGTATCSGNAWGSCQCNDPGWVCRPGTERGCTSGEGCAGAETCTQNGRFAGVCRAPARCPSGWANSGGTCVWRSAYVGAHIDWDQTACGNHGTCASLALDTVAPGGMSQDMYVQVTVEQAGNCNTGNDAATWIGCHNPHTGVEYGRSLASHEFQSGALIELRCTPGSNLIAWKNTGGGAACWRAFDVVHAVNHDPVVNLCTF